MELRETADWAFDRRTALEHSISKKRELLNLNSEQPSHLTDGKEGILSSIN